MKISQRLMALSLVVMLLFQLPFLWKIGMLTRWRLDWRHPGVARVLTLMGPAVFGVSVSQVSLLINTIFAIAIVFLSAVSCRLVRTCTGTTVAWTSRPICSLASADKKTHQSRPPFPFARSASLSVFGLLSDASQLGHFAVFSVRHFQRV